MAQQSETPKRRGRPRLNDDERKRHTMTFRMRDDLRAAVEELAQANGRSLSEQIEYYVEASVRSEAALIYQYSTDAMSATLFKAIRGQDIGSYAPSLDVNFPSGHREMLTIAGQPCLNSPPQAAVKMSWPADFGEIRTLLCEAARDGAQQAISRFVFVDAADFDGKSSVNKSDVPPGANRLLSPVVFERSRLKFGDLAGLSQHNDAIAAYFEQLRQEQDNGDDLSVAALRKVIGRLGEETLGLISRFAPSWPRQFKDLPVDTRSALIGHLQHDAASVYQTLMSPKSPRGESLSAFRRLRNALLPREMADEDAGEGPDEDLGHVEGRADQARR